MEQFFLRDYLLSWLIIFSRVMESKNRKHVHSVQTPIPSFLRFTLI
jgi:hypothetical protein